MLISPEQKSIRELFQNSFLLIPRFQRPYSWNQEEISDFWDDLTNSKTGNYFLGSMVFHRVSKDSESADIVDGQQRLTTVTILLSSIRNHLISSNDKNIAEGIQNFIKRKNVDNEPQFVLFSETSRPYFQDKIQEMDGHDLTTVAGSEEKSLQSAYDFLDSKISTAKDGYKSASDFIEYLKTLRDKILSLIFISIELTSLDDAYVVFETLNTRGKSLEQSDLIKNIITRYLPSKAKSHDTVQTKWSNILENINSGPSEVDADEFLLHHWLSKEGYIARKNLFREVKSSKSKSNIKGYLDDIEHESGIYKKIIHPQQSDWQKDQLVIKDSLLALNIFRVKQSIPFVLSLVSEYESGLITKKQAENAIKRIENFHFIFTAITSQRSSGGISQMYSSAARELRGSRNKNQKTQAIKRLTDKLSEKVPSFEEFIIGFTSLRYSKSYTRQRPIIRYALSKIQRHCDDSGFDDEKYSIEHIASQSSAIVSPEYKFCMGNLAYVPTAINNEKLRNKAFRTKKKILSASNVVIDEWIKSANKWTEAEIDKRLDGLAELSYRKIWKV